MFGVNDNDQQQAVMGPPSVQEPSMLDNVPHDDATATDDGAGSQTQPAANPFAATKVPPASDDNEDKDTEHTMTTDNPFIQNPIGDSLGGPVNNKPSYDINAPTPSNGSGLPATPNAIDPPSADSVAPASDQVSAAAPMTDTFDLKSDDDITATPFAGVAVDNDDVTDDAPTTPAGPIDTQQLANMKQDALSHLEPLVGHLKQSPEEEFKTLLMMIQANDNHKLLEQALVAAKKIEDDKARAQAMLDLINEINYFSQI